MQSPKSLPALTPAVALFLALVLVLFPAMTASVVSCSGEREPTVAEEAAAAAARGIDRARQERTLGRLEQLRTALERHQIDHGGYPEGHSLASIESALAPLYVPRLDTQDAWGHVMSYESDGRSYVVVSAGDDGEAGTGDDILLTDGVIEQGGGNR